MASLVRWRNTLPTSLALLAGVLAACSGPDSTSPVGRTPDLGPSLWVGGPPVPGAIQACAYGPAATYGFTVLSQGPGTYPLGTSFNLQANECEIVFNTTPGTTAGFGVRVTESAVPTGLGVDSVVGFKTDDFTPQTTFVAPTMRFDFFINSDHSGSARFYNSLLDPNPAARHITVCKNGPAGTYNFTVTATGPNPGTLPLGSSFTVDAGQCVDAWTSGAPITVPDPFSTVTVSEVNLPSGIQLDSAAVDTMQAGRGPATASGSTATFTVNAYHDGKVTFFNSRVPPTPKVVTVCKTGPSGTYNFTANVAGTNPGTLLLGATFTVNAGQCRDVWRSSDPIANPEPFNVVTVNEVSLPTTLRLDSTKTSVGGGPATKATSMTVSVNVNALQGASITFFNGTKPTQTGCEDRRGSSFRGTLGGGKGGSGGGRGDDEDDDCNDRCDSMSRGLTPVGGSTVLNGGGSSGGSRGGDDRGGSRGGDDCGGDRCGSMAGGLTPVGGSTVMNGGGGSRGGDDRGGSRGGDDCGGDRCGSMAGGLNPVGGSTVMNGGGSSGGSRGGDDCGGSRCGSMAGRLTLTGGATVLGGGSSGGSCKGGGDDRGRGGRN